MLVLVLVLRRHGLGGGRSSVQVVAEWRGWGQAGEAREEGPARGQRAGGGRVRLRAVVVCQPFKLDWSYGSCLSSLLHGEDDFRVTGRFSGVNFDEGLKNNDCSCSECRYRVLVASSVLIEMTGCLKEVRLGRPSPFRQQTKHS